MKNIAHGAILHHIAISLSLGVAAGAEAARGFFDGQHRHVARQLGVERFLKHLERQFTFGVETDHLADSMHAGIGAAAGEDARELARDFGQRVFQRSLQRALVVGLNLPAGEIGAVVSEREFESAA